MKVFSREEIMKDEQGEWRFFMCHWVSSLGKVKNLFGKTKTMSSDGRYFLTKDIKMYVGQLLAQTFEIQDYELLSNADYYVTKIDLTKDLTSDNIKVVPKSYICERNGKESRQSETFNKKMTWSSPDKIEEKLQSSTIDELPNHIIFQNGEIWNENGKRWMTFSKSGKYLSLCCKDRSYKVHRLICFAFHPLENYPVFDSYSDLQVNHKDGDTFNNHSDNLEWCTQSDNIQHSYDTGLNKKIRSVIQFSLIDRMNPMAEFPSLAKAAKETGEPEHRIREICNTKTNSKAKFYWEWKNKDESEEYSQKFSSMPQ
jgi:hypothetical protein